MSSVDHDKSVHPFSHEVSFVLPAWLLQAAALKVDQDKIHDQVYHTSGSVNPNNIHHTTPLQTAVPHLQLPNNSLEDSHIHSPPGNV